VELEVEKKVKKKTGGIILKKNIIEGKGKPREDQEAPRRRLAPARATINISMKTPYNRGDRSYHNNVSW